MISLQNTTKLFLMILICTLLSCVSAKKKLEKGNYKGAFKSALSKVEKNPDDRPHARILSRSLDKLLTQNQKEIKNLDFSEVSDIKKAIRLTEKMKDNVRVAIPYTGEKFKGAEETLTFQIQEFQNNIADIYFSNGFAYYKSAKKSQSKLEYRNAFLEFEEALSYNPTLENIHTLMDTSLIRAKRIIHVEVDEGFAMMQSWDIERKFEDVTKYSDRFTDVYFDDFNKKSDADCRLRVEFSSLDFDVTSRSETEDFTESIRTGTTTETDTAGTVTEVPVYEDIYGEVETKTETKTGTWDVRVRVSGQSLNCNYSNETYSENIESKVINYELSGDERAIPEEYKNKFSENHTSEDDLAELLLERIFDEFVGDYFR